MSSLYFRVWAGGIYCGLLVVDIGIGRHTHTFHPTTRGMKHRNYRGVAIDRIKEYNKLRLTKLNRESVIL